MRTIRSSRRCGPAPHVPEPGAVILGEVFAVDDEKSEIVLDLQYPQAGIGDDVVAEDMDAGGGGIFLGQEAVFELPREMLGKFGDLVFDLVVEELDEFYLLPPRLVEERGPGSFQPRIEPAALHADEIAVLAHPQDVPPDVFLDFQAALDISLLPSL